MMMSPWYFLHILLFSLLGGCFTPNEDIPEINTNIRSEEWIKSVLRNLGAPSFD
jgi:hypothetical protein